MNPFYVQQEKQSTRKKKEYMKLWTRIQKIQ